MSIKSRSSAPYPPSANSCFSVELQQYRNDLRLLVVMPGTDVFQRMNTSKSNHTAGTLQLKMLVKEKSHWPLSTILTWFVYVLSDCNISAREN